MKPEIILFKHTYTKDSGLTLTDLRSLPLPDDVAFPEHAIITIPAGEIGGNHKHPRSEAFVAFSPGLELHWIDEEGTVQISDMALQTELVLIIVPPYLAHAVINTSAQTAVLLEYATETQHDVTPVQVIQK